MQAGFVGLAAHKVSDGEGEHEIKHVDPNLGVGPVVHGAERDEVGIFDLAEAEFDFGLRAVSGDDIRDGPVAVGEQDPFAEQALLQAFRALGVGVPGETQSAGCTPVRVAVMMSPTQRGLRIVVISAWTVSRSRRVCPRARRACRSMSRWMALPRVWLNPRDCLSCSVGEWVSDRAAGHAERGDGGVDIAQHGVTVWVTAR